MWTLWKKNTQCITFVIKIKKSVYYILHIGIKQDAIILINVYLLCRIKESSASSIFLFLEGEGFGSFTSLGEFLVKRKIYKNFKNSINLFLKFLYIWHLKTFKHLFVNDKKSELTLDWRSQKSCHPAPSIPFRSPENLFQVKMPLCFHSCYPWKDSDPRKITRIICWLINLYPVTNLSFNEVKCETW